MLSDINHFLYDNDLAMDRCVKIQRTVPEYKRDLCAVRRDASHAGEIRQV